ncbi:gamma-glutamyltransferase [Bradyrhizobium sp. AZCC 1693]|uniref:gamma-glutamyltransferase n=1 Tax=Bradyrhizobium sp. AZCC 1693 TaxID=3117029 RepID=UPI00302292F7
MVVSNHPLASSAGAEMLAAGGNAIDAAIATLFAPTVVEPMMVGIIGGGMAHIRLADGSHRFVDGQSTVPLAVRPDTYTSKPGSAHDVFDTVGDENLSGRKAVAVPGSPVEAPRVWTEGNALEVEQAVPDAVRAKLVAMGHKVLAVPTVAGGMNAIQFHEDGTISGAACWRADGTPIGIAGGLARAGVRFGLA